MSNIIEEFPYLRNLVTKIKGPPLSLDEFQNSNTNKYKCYYDYIAEYNFSMVSYMCYNGKIFDAEHIKKIYSMHVAFGYYVGLHYDTNKKYYIVLSDFIGTCEGCTGTYEEVSAQDTLINIVSKATLFNDLIEAKQYIKKIMLEKNETKMDEQEIDKYLDL